MNIAFVIEVRDETGLLLKRSSKTKCFIASYHLVRYNDMNIYKTIHFH